MRKNGGGHEERRKEGGSIKKEGRKEGREGGRKEGTKEGVSWSTGVDAPGVRMADRIGNTYVYTR